MHLVITRPEADAAGLKASLEAKGHTVTSAPMMAIEHLPIDTAALQDAAAVVATSRNALRALERSPCLAMARERPVFVVGKASAALAAQLKFRDVFLGPGTAAELAPAIANFARLKPGPIAVLTGDESAFDMIGFLKSRTISVRDVPAYRAVATTSLPGGLASHLRDGAISGVILMSPRTARTWVELANAALGPEPGGNLSYFCLSEAVAQALRNSSIAIPKSISIAVAARPEIEEILALVDRLAAQSEA